MDQVCGDLIGIRITSPREAPGISPTHQTLYLQVIDGNAPPHGELRVDPPYSVAPVRRDVDLDDDSGEPFAADPSLRRGSAALDVVARLRHFEDSTGNLDRHGLCDDQLDRRVPPLG